MAFKDKPYLGIALSGGTLKGAAHIGVLNALEQLGIVPDVIAGTSAGSLVSTLYAHGYRGEQFDRLLRSFPGIRLLDYGFPLWSSLWSWTSSHIQLARHAALPHVPSGILRGRKLMHYVDRLLAPRRIQIPFYIVATDLVSGAPVIFTSEDEPPERDMYVKMTDIPRAVTGSCALPGIFTPVILDPYILVDGAMRDYVPVEVLKAIGCKKIIAVNLYRLPLHYQPTTLIDVLARSFDILLRESIDNDMVSGPTTFVMEPDLSHIKWKRFEQMRECAEIGRKLVLQRQDELRAFVDKKR